jgi:spermidine/putrescine transport system permease protein
VILPDIMIAVCVLSAFAFFGVPVGYVSLISGHTVIGVGFVIPIISSRLSEIDPVLTEASLDLGATYFQTFRKIWLPWLMPAIIASGLLVFAISMDDFLIAFFCSSPTVQTLSVYIYSMIKTGVDPTINAISTLMLAITSFLVLLLFRLNILDRVIHSE